MARRAGGGWEIRLPLSHQDLANLIGSTRETVTVTLGQLQRERLVRVERRHLIVLNRTRLATEESQAPAPRTNAPRGSAKGQR